MFVLACDTFVSGYSVTVTLYGVPEALRRCGVVGRRVKGVELQAVHHILGFGQTLHHGPSHITGRVPLDGTGLSVCAHNTHCHRRANTSFNSLLHYPTNILYISTQTTKCVRVCVGVCMCVCVCVHVCVRVFV